MLEVSQNEFNLLSDVQRYIQRIANSIEVELSFNTVISDLMKLTNAIIAASKPGEDVNYEILLDSYRKLLIILSPITPCTAEECWERLNSNLELECKSIFHERYPTHQKIESPFTKYNVFVNGRARHSFEALKLLAEKSEAEILSHILKYDDVSKFVAVERIQKVITKPGMISIVMTKI